MRGPAHISLMKSESATAGRRHVAVWQIVPARIVQGVEFSVRRLENGPVILRLGVQALTVGGGGMEYSLKPTCESSSCNPPTIRTMFLGRPAPHLAGDLFGSCDGFGALGQGLVFRM